MKSVLWAVLDNGEIAHLFYDSKYTMCCLDMTGTRHRGDAWLAYATRPRATRPCRFCMEEYKRQFGIPVEASGI